MFFSALRTYISSNLSQISPVHMALIGILSLALMIFHLIRKRISPYGAVTLGFTSFFGLFLLYVTVLIRCGDNMYQGFGLDLAAEFDRLFNGGEHRQLEILSNVVVFVPFGFFLSEFLSTAKRIGSRRQIGYATMIGFILSLCIESLQLILHVGYFELTDLVLNTAGAFIGAGLSVLGRMAIGIDGHKTSCLSTNNGPN